MAGEVNSIQFKVQSDDGDRVSIITRARCKYLYRLLSYNIMIMTLADLLFNSPCKTRIDVRQSH